MATKQKILIVDDAKVPCSSLTLSARTSFYWT